MSYDVVRLDNGRWAKPCPSCGVQQDYLRKNYAEASLRENKLCKTCSNKVTENCHRGWHRGIRTSWFNKFKTSAALRGIPWSLTMDDVADMYEKQEGLCALTGWEVKFPEVGHAQESDASIDRIESQFGYTPDNIQIVHKHVNMMKQQYTQEQFISVCKAVTDKVKW
jgi:hypothetical protein